MTLADSHSIEYRFEDLAIEIAGVRIDTGIRGTAVLVSNPSYTFFVASITLDGTTREPFPKPGRISLDRIPTVLRLDEPPFDDIGPRAILFRILRGAIEADPGAMEAWQAEVDAAME